MKIFLSAVSGQFVDCRNSLASDLRAMGAEVVVQEDFRQHGRTLLEKLEQCIAGCDRVIALVGDAYGFEPPEEARPAGRPRRSYTQWEYAFALGERLDSPPALRKDIYVYFAKQDYLNTHPVTQDAEPADLQRQFVASIVASGEDRNRFDSLDGLCRLALRDGFQVRRRGHTPNNLPFPSLGELFKGRDPFLGELRAKLRASGGHAAAIVAPRVLHGLGGVGKTRAAIEYAWRFADDYGALLFVSAPSPAELRARLSDLVGVLAIPTAETAVEGRLAEVLRWLDEHPGWLLIVDNVDDDKTVREVQGLLARLTAGHVLITSRVANWRAGVEPLELDLLGEDDAVAFLLARTPHRRGQPDDPATALTIARELDGLALALEQAGAYIDQRRLRFSEYVARWKAKRTDVLGWHDETLMGYPASVAVTWETTFSQLGEAERRLLSGLSWLAPEPIPLFFFDSDRLAEDVPEPRDVLSGLAGYSLVRFATDDAVEVHRLVQEVTRGRIPEPERGRTLHLALNSVNSLFPFDADDVRTWAVGAPLSPHAAAVASYADTSGIAGPTTRLMNQLGLYLRARGQFAAAEPLFKRALDIGERSLGPDHPHVATGLNNLAGLLQDTNRLDEAEPLYRRALDIGERSLGPDHPHVATRLNNLAGLLQDTNRLDEAEPLYRRAVAILGAFRQQTGHEHPNFRTGVENYRRLLVALGHTREQATENVTRLIGPQSG